MEPVIYKIRNVVNQKFYVGSTTNKKQRWTTHRKKLRQGKHHCHHLQAAWNKYGEDCFKFEVVDRIADAAHLQDAEATLDDITYVTLGGGITRGPWNCAASTTFRSRNVAGGADLDDRLVAGSCGYEFESGPLGGVAIDGGVKFERVAGIESTTIGLRIARAFEFAVPR